MAIIRSFGLRLLILTLLAPATQAAAAPRPGPDSIRYEEMGCFFYCAVFVVTVDREGRGFFEGKRYTEVQGSRRFRITPAQFRAFEATLAPLRPESGYVSIDDVNHCNGAGVPPTDGASTRVRWFDGRTSQSLHYYSGCAPQEVGLALSRALALLPIKGFLGEPCARNRCR
jgi:hypothetical protein